MLQGLEVRQERRGGWAMEDLRCGLAEAGDDHVEEELMDAAVRA